MTTSNGNSNSESRLDRVERILEILAAELQQTATIARNALQIAESNAQSLERIERIAESNARSIQAWEARIEENRVEAEEERSRLQVAVLQLIEANQQNRLEHELFRRRLEAIDPQSDNQD